ncbi:uncharacterized protein TM35_000142350 [Trypanosoma theileri]|uniref:Uncharacterized protein n=1 Tax=Trypanosoma theileri TaxID=67003 RepID=A0A1X0NWE4_9TRYP|nr:uncharacterized protein TM35_000142350 [Trypanosoma theileri]ORC89024.1 hypothetical protein TM35_000142350 [Trypanosoma theileri]
MPLLLLALARIVGFVVLLIALLCVKKTRLRHLPSRRTRVSRHHGETCVWLERLTSAILDMLHDAIQQQQQQQQEKQQEGEEGDDVDIEDTQQCLRGCTFSSLDSMGTTPIRGNVMSGSSTTTTNNNNNNNNNNNSKNKSKNVVNNNSMNSSNTNGFSCEENGLGSMGMPSRFLEMFEERVEAILEDRGIAASAKCKVHSIGEKPPTIRSIRITNLTGTGSSTNIPAAGSAGVSTTVGGGTSGSGVGVGNSAAGGNMGVVGVNNNNNNNSNNNNATAASLKGKTRLPPGNVYISTGIGNSVSGSSAAAVGVVGGVSASVDDVMEMWRSDSFAEDSVGGAALLASAVELEAEVEYAGGVDVSLDADLCLARGRRLPVSIRVSDVKYMKAHVRVCAKLQYERATMDSQRRPYLQCTLWLESEPTFSLQLTTFISRYRICNFFAVPLVIKFLLLRFLRHRLLRPAGAGLTVNIPLPENVVDGGMQSWCAAVNDAATTVAGSVSAHTIGIPRGARV